MYYTIFKFFLTHVALIGITFAANKKKNELQ
jgi:hypothetical protein